METPFKVVVSISYGDTTKPKYKHTRHLITYSDIVITDHQSQELADMIIDQLLDLKVGEKPLFGIYKEERA